MRPPLDVSGLIDLLVEAIVREMELEHESADESGQEQRRREGQANAILQHSGEAGQSQRCW